MSYVLTLEIFLNCSLWSVTWKHSPNSALGLCNPQFSNTLTEGNKAPKPSGMYAKGLETPPDSEVVKIARIWVMKSGA